jgi:16S rRNA (guanine1207-N2)-methyltransferase
VSANLIHACIGGFDLSFETARGLFSPNAVDAGTLAMLARAPIAPGDKVLDLGCGYGVAGVYAAKIAQPERVWLTDNDPVAIDFARRNLRRNGVAKANVIQSDGFRGLGETGFDKILCNPPYHADFSVPKHLIEKGFNRLAIGGALWMVTKRDAWYRNKLRGVFGSVRAQGVDGYFVFEAVKRSSTYASRTEP